MDQNNQLIPTNEHLLDEINDLKAQLAETRETLLAIQSGSIDALVINNVAGSQIYTLQGADYPYRVLIENMFEGAATISGDLEVVYCNRRLAEMLYLDNRFIVGKNIHNFIYPDDLSAFNQIFEKGKTATHNGEIRIKSPSGQLTDVLVSCTPLNLENAMVCMVFVELSEIKKVQAELRTIKKNL
jgi:PAS domain S-box-containing protein